MNYSIVSNSCVSYFVYQLCNPGVHKMFIDYTNPFIACWFPDDEHYVRFCENYKYYTSLEPRFSEPSTCLNWFRDTGKYRHLNRKLGEYPVMFLGDIEIHWIHDYSEKQIRRKYKERLRLSRKLELVFLWSDPEMFNIHSAKKRNSLFNRFNRLKDKTIFLTSHPSSGRESENTKVVFVPEWTGRTQFERTIQNNLVSWYTHPQISQLFKENMYEDNYNYV